VAADFCDYNLWIKCCYLLFGGTGFTTKSEASFVYLIIASANKDMSMLQQND